MIKKNDKVNYDIIHNTNEQHISVTYGCIRFLDTYRFLSSSQHTLVKALVDISNKTLKGFKETIVDNDEIVEENKTIKDKKKDYPDKIEKIEETLPTYMGENELKTLNKDRVS